MAVYLHYKRALLAAGFALMACSPACWSQEKLYLSATPAARRLYIGQSITLFLTVTNRGKTPVRVLRMPMALMTRDIDIGLEGEKVGRLQPTEKIAPPAEPQPTDYCEVGPDDSLIIKVDLKEMRGLSPTEPDKARYLRLVYFDCC